MAGISPNRYRIEKLVGEGGMAAVYRAYDRKLDRRVAVKILKSDKDAYTVLRSQLNSEASAMAKLNNPHIVSVYDVADSSANELYIVMEYVDGINLREALNRHGAFDARAVAQIGIQACDALEKAHAMKLVHSDMKPSNMLLTRSSEIKLTDFGISRLVTGASKGLAGFGTPQYISPQQASGEQASPQDDVFSLGASLYELCCGFLPWSPLDDAFSHGVSPEYQPLHPSSVNATSDAAFDRILFTSIQKAPQARYKSAQQFREALEKFAICHPMSTDVLLPPSNPPACWALVPLHNGIPYSEGIVVRKNAIVGRRLDSDIVLRHQSVSRQHMRLVPWGACLVVEDIESTNGTLLNGEPIVRRAFCYPGDVLRLGNIELLVGCKH